jgi:hypothetical protein
MQKYKLQTTPKCRRCRAPTRHYRTFETQFLNQRFEAEWYMCIDCEKIQAKIVKMLGEIHGAKISDMV